MAKKKKTQEEEATAEVDAEVEEATSKKSKKKAKQDAADAAAAEEEAAASKKDKKKQKAAAQEEEGADEGGKRKKQKVEGESGAAKTADASTGAAAKGGEAGTEDAAGAKQRTAKEGRIARKKAQQQRRKLRQMGIDPDSAEAKRRMAQRDMKTLVMKLRSETQDDKEIAKAKLELKKKVGSFSNPEGRREKKKQAWLEWVNSAEVQEHTKKQKEENKERQHDLVIIPVTWRGRHDKLDVQKAAEDVKACVAQQGVDAWIDSRRQFTPGQKFAHWEFRGVMLRVEVGPEDVEKGLCRVCKATTPGDYQSVQKKSVRLPPGGGRKLLLTLKEWGLDKIEVERQEGEEDDDSEDEPVVYKPKGQKKADPAEAVEVDDLMGNWAPKNPEAENKAKKTNKRKRGK